MIVPKAETFAEALRMGVETYFQLKKNVVKKYGAMSGNIGKEGGFAIPAKKTEDALKLLMKTIKDAGHKDKVFISLDCAASEFYKSRKYHIDGKKINTDNLLKYYEKLLDKYPIINLEDAFQEDDLKAFARLSQETNVQVTGDDLFATNVGRVKKGIQNQAGNALLLKVNQIGTLTEAFAAAKFAQQTGYRVMVSHRSGERCDPFISDLAVGIGASQIKAGAPCRGERVAKYNRLLEIEESGVPYTGWFS
jgi:enolase